MTRTLSMVCGTEREPRAEADVRPNDARGGPFPGHVAEPTRCTAPTPASFAPSDGVVAVHPMPRDSLTGVPGASDPQ